MSGYCRDCGNQHCVCDMPRANGVSAVLGEVLHDIGVWGIENNIPVTKTDKLKAIMVKHFA